MGAPMNLWAKSDEVASEGLLVRIVEPIGVIVRASILAGLDIAGDWMARRARAKGLMSASTAERHPELLESTWETGHHQRGFER